jgi:hypothetical protein
MTRPTMLLPRTRTTAGMTSIAGLKRPGFDSRLG